MGIFNGGTWNFTKKYIFNIDTLIVLIIVGLVIYFYVTRNNKSKTYKFQGFLDSDRPIEELYYPSLKKKNKKKKKINKHEEECRRIFEEIFGVKFKSIRPDWLKNPVTNKNLELDGFNADLKTNIGTGLAFEYDGVQHSQYNSHFHRSGPDEFKYQVKKDDWKNAKCKEKNVVLIRIPHFVNFNDLGRYIRQELKRQNVDTYTTTGSYSNTTAHQKFMSRDNIYGN